MAKEAVNEHGVKLSDISVGDTVRYRVGKDGRYSRSKEVTATVIAVGVKRERLRSSAYNSAKHGIGNGSGNWLVVDAASENADFTNRVWEEYTNEESRRIFRSVDGQWFLNISKVTLVGTETIEAEINEEIERTLRSEERKQEWADEEAAREAVLDDILAIINAATGKDDSRWGKVDPSANKVTLTFEEFAQIIGRVDGEAITQKQVDTIEEAKAKRAGTTAKVRVNPGGDYRDAREVKVRWDESGTKLDRV